MTWCAAALFTGVSEVSDLALWVPVDIKGSPGVQSTGLCYDCRLGYSTGLVA